MTAIALGLIAALAWGIHDILVRLVSQKLGILISLSLVLIFGILAQTPLVLMFGDFSQLSQRSMLFSAAAGITFAFACIGLYNAFQRGPVRLVAPVIGCYSVLAFLASALSGSSVTTLQWLALAGLVAGIALIARSPDDEIDESDAGGLKVTLAYSVLAMVGFFLTFELGQRASAIADPYASGLITRTVAAIIVSIVLIFHIKKSNSQFSVPRAKNLIILALMGLLDAIALAMVLTAGAFPRPEFASAASSPFGLVTVVLAWIFLREKISPGQWLGIALVFGSIAYLALGAGS